METANAYAPAFRASEDDPIAILNFFDDLDVFLELNGPRHRDSSSLVMPANKRPPLMRLNSASSASKGFEPPQPSSFTQLMLAEDTSHGYTSLPSSVPYRAAHPAHVEQSSREETRYASSPRERSRRDSPGDRQSPVPAKMKKQRKKPSSQRHREELIYLRTKVNALKDRLEGLKQESRLALLKASNTSVPSSAALWQALAWRQLEAKERAEGENAKLRAQLKVQLKFAKMLERVMQKRRDGEDENEHNISKVPSKNDAEVFASLQSSVDARASRLDDTFSAQGLTPESLQTRNESSFTFDKESGLHIDFVRSKAALFNVPTVANAMWDQMTMVAVRAENTDVITEVVNESANVKHIKQSIAIPTFSLEKEDRVTTARIVCRRIVEEHRVRFIWETLTECRGAVLRGMPSVQLVERGCGQIFRCSAPASSSAHSMPTMLQSTVTAIPVLSTCSIPSSHLIDLLQEPHAVVQSEASSPGSQSGGAEGSNSSGVTMKAFIEMIIAAFQESAETASRVIENQLVDQMRTLAA